MADDEKKIIIDENWKSQVQSEKEELEESRKEGGGDAAGGPSAASAFPPASFEMHLSALVTEAMVALGKIPHPLSGQPEKNLGQAKYIVDTVEMLEEKTRGNLSEQESLAITDLLHQLRMLYVAVQSEPEGAPSVEAPP